MLSTDGTVTPTGVYTGSFLYQSPDKTEWLAFNDQVQMFSGDGKALYEMDLPAGMAGETIFAVVWRKDQSGLFFSYSGSPSGIYSVDFLENQVGKVDPSDIAAIYFNYSVWIGGPN